MTRFAKMPRTATRRQYIAGSLNEHVAGMADVNLKEFLTQAGINVGGSTTISRRETHTFFNFDFEAK
jgi:hypothetical protein